jgi:cytochrome c oxidase assembly protein subunit 15
VICAGGNVKSKDAGLAVPDWPQSYGLPDTWVIAALAALVVASGTWIFFAYRRRASLFYGGLILAAGAAILFTYIMKSPPRWIQIENMRAEHGHRLLAGGLGVFLLALVICVLKYETNVVVRRLAVLAFAGFLAQAALGGLTVIIFLKASVYHAMLAQIEFGLLVAMTYVMVSPPASAPMSKLFAATTAAVYLQILLGALVRHYEAAMAIPGFPLPLAPETWTLAGVFQFVHRLGALAVAALVVASFVKARKQETLKPALAMLVMVVIQILLGASIVWTGAEREYNYIPTAHVAVGSLIVACSLVLTLQSRRVPVHEPAAL